MTTLSLRQHEIEALSELMDCLQSPLNFATTHDWQEEVLGRMESLFGVNRGAFSLPDTAKEDADNPALPQKWYLLNLGRDVMESHYYWQKEELQKFFPEDFQETTFKLGVYNRNVLWNSVGTDWKETAYYHEWMVPNRLGSMFGISDIATRADIRCYSASEAHSITPNDLAMGRLILPALRAGARAEQSFRSSRTLFDSLIDRLPESVILFDHSGKPVHINEAASKALRADPEANVLLAKTKYLALKMLSEKSANLVSREPTVLDTGRKRWSLEATFPELAPFGERTPVMVTITELPSFAPVRGLSPGDNFHFTARETEVAQLLGRRLTNREVATELGMSEHTARHHTERVLKKMGVGSRRDVSKLL